jgi:peptidoglycan/LPS O-acetylase OafA/YrhL
MNTDIQNNQRIFGLDVVRAIAILMVVFSHVYYLIDSSNPLLISVSGLFGFFGVELFFVLSGFLIGTILLKKYMSESFSYKDIFIFLKRRWFRTLPTYYLVLILNIVVALIFGYSIDGWAAYFVFFQNFIDYKINFFTESWSLSVEEWTYLLIPFVLIFTWKILKKNKKSAFLITVLVLILFFHILRYFVYLEKSFSDMTTWNSNLKSLTVYRIDSILFGFVTAWLHMFYKGFLQKYKGYMFIVSLHLFLFQFVVMNVLGFDIVATPLYYKVFYFTLTSFTIFLALPLFVFWNTTQTILGKPIQLISKISYSMYLLHYSIVTVLMKYVISNLNIQFSNVVIIMSYMFITILSSYFLYRFFEKPMMDLRDR